MGREFGLWLPFDIWPFLWHFLVPCDFGMRSGVFSVFLWDGHPLFLCGTWSCWAIPLLLFSFNFWPLALWSFCLSDGTCPDVPSARSCVLQGAGSLFTHPPLMMAFSADVWIPRVIAPDLLMFPVLSFELQTYFGNSHFYGPTVSWNHWELIELKQENMIIGSRNLKFPNA